MTPDEAYPIFVEAIQAAKAQGIAVVGGVYGIARRGGTFVPDDSEADYNASDDPWAAGRVPVHEVCPVGAVVLHRCANAKGIYMTDGVAAILGVGVQEVRAITNGVDGTSPSLMNPEWYDLGERLRREFSIPNVYDRKTN